ncbi:MAG: class I SAM-dependent methyltransferase [Thermincolia bacterium]
MKPQTIALLKCPLCNTGFTLEAAQWAVLKDGEELIREVKDGKVTCGNNHEFPIKDFILRFDVLLPIDVQKKAEQRGNIYRAHIVEKPHPGTGKMLIPNLTEGAITKHYFNLHPLYTNTKRIVEIGCGDGYWSVLLRKCGWEVIGIDPSFAALLLAKDKTIIEGMGVDYICGTENVVRFHDGVLDGRFSFASLKPVQLNNEICLSQAKPSTDAPIPAPQAETTFPCGAIYKGRAVGQFFRSPKGSFRAIDVMMSTYNRVNKGNVTFHLRAAGSKGDLVRIAFPAHQLRNNSFKRFNFPPVKNAKGRSYYFYFSSPQPGKNQGVTALATKNSLASGALTINHRRLAGSLVFRVI